MDAIQWQRVKELFASALAREPAQRSTFLAEACGADEALHQEVESLLAEYQETAVAAGAAAVTTAEASPPPRDALRGRYIGPYQVVRRIGQGGMSTVYLAVRADGQYKKRVAIKLIPPGLDNQELLNRFRNERQTLAALDHPNIVRLVDGGSTADGLPYLVMDYVEGTSIDEYCDSHKLSIDERLRLFLSVCTAVSYAHQRLVIHRDLKPGNILVADGTVKLLDFGIAKLLNPETAATLLVTRTGQRAMTPEYASPEQIRGEPVTVATDVYSLGVLLYELLTGHRPYRMKRYTVAEIEHAICEEEPLKPSTVVTQVEEETNPDGTTTAITPEAISRTRDGDVKKLRSRLSGDLDAIVLTALRKEPQRRYTSVQEFSEDIQRHLEGSPVKARPRNSTYRLSKFVRRHRESTLAVTITLLLAGALTIWMVDRLPRRTSSAEQPPVTSSSHPRRAVAVMGFQNLSGNADADWISTALEGMLTTELGAGEKMRTIPGELVAQARAGAPFDYAETLSQPTLAKLRRTLGTDLVVLGSYVTLKSGQIRLDLRVQDATSGETTAEDAEVGMVADLFDLVSRSGGALRRKLGIGEVTADDAPGVRASLPSNPEALRLYAGGLAKLRVFDSLAAKDLLQQAITADPKFALAHSALADVWTELGYDARRKEEAKKAFELARNLPREDQLWIEGRHRDAASLWPRAIEVYRSLFTFAPDNIEYGLRLATTQRLGGKPADALNTIASLRALPPPARDDPRIDLAEADAADTTGDFKHGQQAARRALDKAKVNGAKLLAAEALGHETWACYNLGDLACAGAAAEEARTIYAAVGDQSGVSKMLESLGRVFSRTGDLRLAETSYGQALKINRDIGSQGGVASVFNNTAILFAGQGRLAQAKQMWEQALAVYRELEDRDSEAAITLNIAEILEDLGDLPNANAHFREALSIYREVGDQSGVAYSLENNSRVLFLQGNLGEAEKMLKSALGLYQQLGDQHSSASALQGLGDILHMKADFEEASKRYSQALTIRSQIKEELNGVETQLAISQLSIEQGHAQSEEVSVRQARDRFHRENQADDELLASTILVDDLLAQGKTAEARKEIETAEQLAAKSQNREMRLKFALARARVWASSNWLPEAKNNLEGVIAEATQFGFAGYQLEARLTLADIEIASGQMVTGRNWLASVQKDAAAKGFGLIARKAASAAAQSQLLNR